MIVDDKPKEFIEYIETTRELAAAIAGQLTTEQHKVMQKILESMIPYAKEYGQNNMKELSCAMLLMMTLILDKVIIYDPDKVN